MGLPSKIASNLGRTNDNRRSTNGELGFSDYSWLSLYRHSFVVHRRGFRDLLAISSQGAYS